MVWIGFIWLRIGTSGGPFGFHKMLGSSWVAAQLAASQEGLSSMSDWHGSSSPFTAQASCSVP
jgi:hypothetical protein